MGGLVRGVSGVAHAQCEFPRYCPSHPHSPAFISWLWLSTANTCRETLPLWPGDQDQGPYRLTWWKAQIFCFSLSLPIMLWGQHSCTVVAPTELKFLKKLNFLGKKNWEKGLLWSEGYDDNLLYLSSFFFLPFCPKGNPSCVVLEGSSRGQEKGSWKPCVCVWQGWTGQAVVVGVHPKGKREETSSSQCGPARVQPQPGLSMCAQAWRTTARALNLSWPWECHPQ